MFLDLEMPGLNGIQVIRDLRKYIKDLNLELEKSNMVIMEPIIVLMTSFQTKGLKVLAKSMQIEECFEKPI